MARARTRSGRRRSGATRVAVLGATMLLMLASCVDSDDGGDRSGSGQQLLVAGLEEPTQMVWHPDGRLVVAVLGAGGEGSPTGQVIAIDLDGGDGAGVIDLSSAAGADGEPDPDGEARGVEVLVSGLDTPTGIAVIGDELWIMERTRLVVAPLSGGTTTVVRNELPSNGRSNGTLTATSDGTLIYNTSGSRSGAVVAAGSGVLWLLDPTDRDVADRALLTGMKNAYAVAETNEVLLVTEIGDGTFDGAPPNDELVRIPNEVADEGGRADPSGASPSGGWPLCINDRQPVAELGVDAGQCAGAVPSVALFAPGATPTSVVVAPWDTTRALVSLWLPGQIVEVALDADIPTSPRVVMDELERPQHLLTDDRPAPDGGSEGGGRVLVSVYGTGEVWALSRDALGG